MRRLACHAFGTRDGLALESEADPRAGPGQVLIRVKAANVAYVDRLTVQGDYQVKPPVPFTGGVVGAGQVLEVAPEVKHLRPGDRVTVLKRDMGVWATHVVVPVNAVVQTPSGVSDIAAVACIEAYGTASYALEERGRLQAGETVLVLGAGGAVGHAAVATAVHLDARVVLVTSEPQSWLDSGIKPEMIVDRRAGPLREVMRSRFPNGVDVVVDPVGGDLAEAALRSLTFGGRYLVVGFASGTIPRLPVNHILLRNRSVVGVEWASWIDAHAQHLSRTMEIVLNRLARGVFTPPECRTISLDELPDILFGPPPRSGLVRTVVLPQ